MGRIQSWQQHQAFERGKIWLIRASPSDFLTGESQESAKSCFCPMRNRAGSFTCCHHGMPNGEVSECVVNSAAWDWKTAVAQSEI
jgi:hypothetical protein